jgi:oligoendopeptidase F
MENKLPKRSEVDVELTWKLEDIFASESEWEKALSEAKSLADELAGFTGKVGESADTLYKVLETYEKCCLKIHLVYGYAFKMRDVDTTSTYAQTLYSKVMSADVEISEKIAFMEPEIIAVDEETMNKFYTEKPELNKYKIYITEVRRGKEHSLSPELEKLLAGANELADLPYEVFATLGNADLKFPEITNEKGEKVQITNGRFVPLEESKDRSVRKEVFEKFYETFGNFKNTSASLYAGQVKQLMFYARARKYSSTLEAAVDGNNVSPEVYKNLVEAVNDNLDKMHRYVRLRKKLLELDELHMYDIYVPIVKDYDAKYTIEEAKELVLKAVEPLGTNYVNLIKKAFAERWIDVVENEGKRNGAYSSGVYGVHPFVLLNFNGTLDNVFTLAHEMGHAMHSYFSNEAQNYLDSRYKIFVAEVASTTNEVLLMEFMLKNAKDSKERAYLLNHYMDSFKGTVFRQTMFAEFEKTSNEMAESGEPLTHENLTKLYLDLNKKYYGEAMISDDLIGYEWMRIPHFYYNFYVYQYATGFSAAVAIANRVLKEGETAVNDYMKFLQSGCTKDPVSLLRIAGVDMATKEPINSALQVFERVIEEMEELTK